MILHHVNTGLAGCWAGQWRGDRDLGPDTYGTSQVRLLKPAFHVVCHFSTHDTVILVSPRYASTKKTGSSVTVLVYFRTPLFLWPDLN